MSRSSKNARNSTRLDALVLNYRQSRQVHANTRDNTVKHWVYLPAILFSVLGILFTINFGLALIAIAVAILYFSRYGQKIAVQLGAALLVMLAAWMLLMPAHHLVAACLGIFLLALGGQFFGQIRAQGHKPSFAEWRQYLLAGPVYALLMMREQVTIRENLGENPGFDPS